MKKILIIVFLMATVMCYSQVGFVTYEKEVVQKLTPAEYLEQMEDTEKAFVINSFANKLKPKQVNKTNVKAPVVVIVILYTEIKNIRDYSAQLMRGKVGSGQMFMMPPKNKSALITALVKKFKEYFNNSQITLIVDKMLLYSKKNLANNYVGDWTTYKIGVQQ